jgi:hypothetical protein
MRFDKKTKTLEMDLINLEHCDFNYGIFLGELFLNGIDDPEAERPEKLIVNFKGCGHSDNQRDKNRRT